MLSEIYTFILSGLKVHLSYNTAKNIYFKRLMASYVLNRFCFYYPISDTTYHLE